MAEARAAIVREYLADREARPEGTRVAMAHRRADVRALNEAIRSALQERGELARVRLDAEVGNEASRSEVSERPRAFVYQTNDGKREFAEGDRIVFLENNRDLGVKNGMLGTVEAVEPGRVVARLDGAARVAGSGDYARTVSVSMGTYSAIDHGYATTIHKNQGATVDRAYVLASGTMDRHLTYVAMTRHREAVQLHVAYDEFASRQAGVLVEHGKAPFEHDAANRPSYFVTVETSAGERHTMWGVDLERAMAAASPAIGETIELRHEGAVPVRLPDGTEVERNNWTVLGADDLVWQRLEDRLSRSGAKETTLDYRGAGDEVFAERQFAERRGIAESFGIRSEIEVGHEGAEEVRFHAERVSVAEAHALARGSARQERADLAQDPRKDLDADRQQRRSSFEGLKLTRAAAPALATKLREQDRGAAVEARSETAATVRRGMFDGLKLGAGRGAVPERAEAVPEHRPEREVPAESDRLAERVRASSAFEAAVDRYARAYGAADRQVRERLPLLEGQKQELAAAGQALDQARPGAHELMRLALKHDPEARRVLSELTGVERASQLAAGMERERAAVADPGVRAERFVERWKELRLEHRYVPTYPAYDGERTAVEEKMRGLVKGLETDPDLAAVLDGRRQELGLPGRVAAREDIAADLGRKVEQIHESQEMLGLTLTQGPGM